MKQNKNGVKNIVFQKRKLFNLMKKKKMKNNNLNNKFMNFHQKINNYQKK